MKAKGIEGFLLYSPFTKGYFFRVYEEDKKKFTDYELRVEDIKVVLNDDYVSLVKNKDGKNYLTYNKKK